MFSKSISLFLSLMLFITSLQASISPYIGMNVGQYKLSAKNALQLDATKVNNAAGLAQSSQQSFTNFNPEWVVGLTYNYRMLSLALEGFIDPAKQTQQHFQNNAYEQLTQRYSYGARIKPGISWQSWMAYGIAGIGRTSLAQSVYFTGAYAQVPILLQSIYNGQSLQTKQLGLGLSYELKKHIALQLEYIKTHINTHGSLAVNHQLFSFLNPIGSWQSTLSGEQIQVGLKFFIP